MASREIKLKEIYDIICLLNKNLFSSNNKGEINDEGFLIEKKIMSNYLKEINYENLKFCTNKKVYPFQKVKAVIDKELGNKKIKEINFINPSDSRELKYALNNKTEFYLLNKELCVLISKKNEKGIKYNIKDNLITLFFNNGKEKFIFDQRQLISKSNLIQILENEDNQNSFYENQLNQNKKNLYEEEQLNKEIESLENFNFDIFICINCGSEVELDFIDYDISKINYISYYCSKGCGRIKITIDDYIKKFKFKTYLNETCFNCGVSQAKKIKNNFNNLFLYCIDCQKIYCENCSDKPFKIYHKFIKINQKNEKCHEDIYDNDDNSFISYCATDKKNLCQKCIKEHLNFAKHKICDFESIKPIKINEKNDFSEEEEIFNNIIQYFNDKIIEENNKYENKRKNLEKQCEDNINSEYSNFETNQNINKSNQINIINEQFDNKKKKFKEDFVQDFEVKGKIVLNQFFSEMSNKLKSISNDFKNHELEIFNKYDLIIQSFDEIKDIFNSCLEKIKSFKTRHDKSLELDKIEFKKKVKNVEFNHQRLLTEFNNNCIKKNQEIRDTYLQKEFQILSSKTKFYKTHKKIGEIIYNAYIQHKHNYYNIKNFFNLMKNYYNIPEISYLIENNIINRFNNKEILLTRINEKKRRNYNKIKEEFSIPPLISFNDKNDIRYLNPILQCLCNIEDFSDFFKHDNFMKEIKNSQNDKQLSISFSNIVEYLWPSSNFDYSLNDFQNVISKMNNINFKNIYDLLISLIKILHQELNHPTKDELPQNNNIVNVLDPILVYKNYRKNFQNENNSFISEKFFYDTYNYIQCFSCQKSMYKFHTCENLEFNIDEVFNDNANVLHNQLFFNNNIENIMNTKFMKNNINILKEKQSKINLIDCFNYRQKIEKNDICGTCKNNVKYNTILYTAPQILIILLKRNENKNKKKFVFEFGENLDLSNYITLNSFHKFNLISFIEYSDNKYTAYCKNIIDNNWYKYEDNLIKLVPNICEINKTDTCIIFYKKE